MPKKLHQKCTKPRFYALSNDPIYIQNDVNELSVSMTSYANFVVKGFFSVTVVKEMQVLLTTHK